MTVIGAVFNLYALGYRTSFTYDGRSQVLLSWVQVTELRILTLASAPNRTAPICEQDSERLTREHVFHNNYHTFKKLQ